MSSSFEPGKAASFGSSASTSQQRSGSITNYSTAASFRPPTSDSASSSSTLPKPWYDSNGIWGSSFTSTSSAARQNTAPRSALHFGSQNGKQPGKDTIEGKTGSGQLVDSSVSEDYEFRPFYPKRDVFAKPNEASFPQNRSNSNGGLPQAFPGASRQSSSFSSSRPTTSGFNTASSANTKPQFASSNLDSPLSYMNDPPPVFTKFERPAKPQASQPTDSAYGDWIDGNMTHSPVEDRRRPSVPGYFGGGGLPSAPQSRNNSLPPSRHSDIPPTYPTRSDAFSTSQASTNLLRGSSVSSASRNNGSFGAVDVQTNPLAQFSQMNLQNDSQTLVSQRPSFSGSSFLNQAAAAYSRNELNEHADDVEEIGRAAQAPFTSDNYTPQSSNDYMTYRGPPYNERSVPNGNTYNPRNGPPNPSFQRQFEPSPGFPPANGFPTVPNPHATAALDQRLRLLAEQQQMNPFFLNMQMQSAAYGQFGGNFYPPYRLPNGVSSHGYPTMPPSMPLGGMPMVDVPKGPRELEAGLSLRSALLEEFKNNNKTRRYELKDIYDHVVEFSGDQHGSRFIQQKLETANSDEKERIFREIQPNAVQLMMDVFGNYVIQKFFEHGDQNQKKIFANKMKGRVLDLSLQMYGCRVVQQALEHILNDQQAMLVRELERDVLKCVKDQNGNHVIQKAIERCEATDIAFIFQSFAGQVQHLSIHTYGCRVIQRSLEYCKPDTKRAILAELHDCMPTLIGDSFGNYVAQHVVQFGFEADKQRVLELVLKGLEGYSKHKFASNVVEKCLQCSDDAWKREVIEVFARNNRRDGEGMMLGLIRDNYGNYVIQKLLHLLKGDDYTYFVELLLPELVRAKRTGCGKQVLAIEKTLSKPTVDQHLQSQTPFGSRNISQNTTPPPLTADTRSVQTSSVASVNGDALEGAASSRKGSVQHTEPTVFET